MPETASTRLGLVGPSDTDLVSDGDDIMRAIITQLEAVGARIDHGTSGARPSASISDRFYFSTDTGVLSRDSGSAWTDINPIDAAAGTASLRTLGTTSTSAAAGNDSRFSDARVPTAHASSHAAGGSDPLSAAIATRSILDVGVDTQTRAGRQLALADFTTLLGLSAPVGLWNLGDTSDISGNSRTLSNKGTVTFGAGITGAATEAAIFTGSTAQALYIADTGGADPFRIRTGSWGCWFKTAKRGTFQMLISKDHASTNANKSYYIGVDSTTNSIQASATVDTSATVINATGTTIVTDDRWHFAVATFDGNRTALYIDGVLEIVAEGNGLLNPSPSPFNIGGRQADGSTIANLPHYGRVDEAFVTGDVLTLRQIRLLYALKLAHGLAITPQTARVSVRPRSRGAALVSGDFPTQPLRLHNFTAGALTDAGSNNVTLTNNNTAVAVAGADGTANGAFQFIGGSSQYLSSTDTGLPSGTATVTMGCWAKIRDLAMSSILNYGSAVNTERLVYQTGGAVRLFDNSGEIDSVIYIADGNWHFIVAIWDAAAADGLVKKLYIDGRLAVSGTASVQSITLGGANAFRVGRRVAAGTNYFSGSIDSVFVCDYALTASAIASLYAKGSLALGVSPKNPGDHVELIDATNMYVVGDTLESQHQIDLGVTT